MAHFRIMEVRAILSVDEATGDEGVVAATINGMLMPLVAADERRFEAIEKIGRQIAEDNGMRFIVAKFTVREDIGQIGDWGDKQ